MRRREEEIVEPEIYIRKRNPDDYGLSVIQAYCEETGLEYADFQKLETLGAISCYKVGDKYKIAKHDLVLINRYIAEYGRKD